jgi:uncharacterized protein (TIGR02271 family)
MEYRVPFPANPSSETPRGDLLITAGMNVIDAEGRIAKVIAVHCHQKQQTVSLKMDSGQEIELPVALLMQQDGSLRLPTRFAELCDAAERDTHITIPVWSEQLHVNKQSVDTGKGVRIHKNVVEHDKIVNVSLMKEELFVEHVPIQKVVSETDLPLPRQEGEVYIVPVLEEVLVVEKRICLKEEVRISKRRQELPGVQTVRVKSEQVSIEQFDDSNESDKGRSASSQSD